MATDDTESAQREAPQETEEVRNAHPLARFFFLKTTFGLLLLAILVAGGVMAALSMTKESYPDLEIPFATVTTTWPGADPQTIEEQVTNPIEDEIVTLQGLQRMDSASYDSFSIISVEFTAQTDPDEAMNRLRAAVSTAEAEIASDADRPVVDQASVNDRPILTLVLYGDASDAELGELAETVQDRLETISGVNEAELGGARDTIIQILLNPHRLLALGLPPTSVRNAIGNANLDQPFGEIENEAFGGVVRLEGQFREVEDIEALRVPLPQQSGDPVRLGSIASVERQLEPEETRAFLSTEGERFTRSVEISITKTPGADTIAVIDQILSRMNEFQNDQIWIDGVRFEVTQNEATQIWDSLTGVFNSAWQAILAVFVVLFLILSWREGLIAGLSIPVSFLGAMLVIWMLGYTLNEIVIIGMVLALGLLVDVFILMLEGIHEEIYQNKHTFGQAALKTVERYGVPAFAGQLTTILALAPLMAISGTQGKFIRVLPVTAIACLIVAFVVALLVTVPLSRFLLQQVARRETEDSQSGSDRVMSSLSERLRRFNRGVPLKSKKAAGAFVGGAVALFVLSMLAISQAPVVLYPKTDGLNLGVNIELPPSAPLERSADVAGEVGEILREKPYFDSVIMLVGRKSPFAAGGGLASLQPTNADNFIGFSATFVERSDRDAPGYEIAAELREELQAYLLQNVPGADLRVVPETGSPTTGEAVEIDLKGPDFDVLQQLSRQVQDELGAIDGAVDVRDSLGSVGTEIALRPDPEAVEFFGLTQTELAAQIRFALSNDTIGRFATVGPEDDLDIRMGTDWPSQRGEGGGPRQLEELAMVRAFGPNGETVPLLSVVEPYISEGPASLVHSGGERTVTVLAGNDGATASEITEAIRPRLEAMSADWPRGYSWSVGGESEEIGQTFGSAGVMLVVALILVFGVLVIVFGSFPQAFILLATMPLALIGTFLGFFVFQIPFSFFAMIGVVSLIGIVANNGIVMVDTMNRKLKDGAEIASAAADGAADRLRPILSTTATTIVGLVPLAISSPMYRPLCLAIIFGLFTSTILSLVVVPALYLLLTREGRASAEALD